MPLLGLSALLFLALALSCNAAFLDEQPAASIFVLPSFAGLISTLRLSAPADEDQQLQPVLSMHNETKGPEAISCPTSCFRPNPVCGVNGVTYWCGAADADCAGVEVKSQGYCNIDGSRGTGGRGALAVQSLLLIHMIWLVLAGLLVLLGLP